jgi:HNH endonuclease
MSDKPNEAQGKAPRVLVIKDHRVIIDAEDFPILSRFKWHIRKDKNTHYAETSIKIGHKNCKLSMHRLLCGIPTSEVDHINRNGLDNRKTNLRFCTPQQNQCNRVRKNKYGYRGVCKPEDSSCWAYQIQNKGKKIYKRGFKTAEEAVRVYDKKSMELHGEFGIRNFKS